MPSSFITRLNTEVASLAKNNKVAKSKAFLLWFAKKVLELTRFSATLLTMVGRVEREQLVAVIIRR